VSRKYESELMRRFGTMTVMHFLMVMTEALGPRPGRSVLVCSVLCVLERETDRTTNVRVERLSAFVCVCVHVHVCVCVYMC
jgi:hypothetical protein